MDRISRKGLPVVYIIITMPEVFVRPIQLFQLLRNHLPNFTPNNKPSRPSSTFSLVCSRREEHDVFVLLFNERRRWDNGGSIGGVQAFKNGSGKGIMELRGHVFRRFRFL
jgi:hypothetical protein